MSVAYQQETQRGTLAAELQASLAREEMLIRDKRELRQRHVVLAQEFEHRLVNGLQLIASLLHMQSRAAMSIEAAAQLTVAAQRVASLGRVHHQLHCLDDQERIEFKQYLENLCGDLSRLLFQEEARADIAVTGEAAEIPTSFAIPLGFIVNELITNSAKHTKGSITVRFETMSPTVHSLSVSDDGPGLPTAFNPADSKGLGMKIVLSLVKQIDGQLSISAGENGQGACFTIAFRTKLHK